MSFIRSLAGGRPGCHIAMIITLVIGGLSAPDPSHSSGDPVSAANATFSAWLVFRQGNRSDSLALEIPQSVLPTIRSGHPDTTLANGPLPFDTFVMAMRSVAASGDARSGSPTGRSIPSEYGDGPWWLTLDGYFNLDGGGGVTATRGSGSMTLGNRRGRGAFQLSVSGELARTTVVQEDLRTDFQTDRMSARAGMECRLVGRFSAGGSVSGNLESAAGRGWRNYEIAGGVEFLPFVGGDTPRGPLSVRAYLISSGGRQTTGSGRGIRSGVIMGDEATDVWTSNAFQFGSSIETFPSWGMLRATGRARRHLGVGRWLLQSELNLRVPLTQAISLNISSIYGNFDSESSGPPNFALGSSYSSRLGIVYTLGGWSDESQLLNFR